MDAHAPRTSPDLDGAGTRPVRTAGRDELSHRVTAAENVNPRERVARLEASIASRAADLDAANDETTRLRREIMGLERRVREAEDRRAVAEDARAQLVEDVSARDGHIAQLEARLHEHDLAQIDTRRARTRLHALRTRMRARMRAQAEEIEGLRRTLALGHAARVQVEAELRECRLDARRNARYLDKLEERLRAVEGREG